MAGKKHSSTEAGEKAGEKTGEKTGKRAEKKAGKGAGKGAGKKAEKTTVPTEVPTEVSTEIPTEIPMKEREREKTEREVSEASWEREVSEASWERDLAEKRAWKKVWGETWEKAREKAQEKARAEEASEEPQKERVVNGKIEGKKKEVFPDVCGETLLDDLPDTVSSEPAKFSGTLSELVRNLDIPLSKRIDIFRELYRTLPEKALSYFVELYSVYNEIQTSNISNYLREILKLEIEPLLKIECCKMIYEIDPILGREFYMSVYTQHRKELNPLILADVFYVLLEDPKTYDILSEFVRFFIALKEVGIVLRMRKNDKILEKITDSCLMEWLKSPSTTISSKILVASDLFVIPKYHDTVEKHLLDFCTDDKLDFDLRVNAADLLLQNGSEKSQEIAKALILAVGELGVAAKTIFTDRQNVHEVDIAEAVKTNLQKLIERSDAIPELRDSAPTFESISDKIQSLMEKAPGASAGASFKKKINSSLTRISADRSLYLGLTLKTILIKLWKIIVNSPKKELLTQRLLEELSDMADTCFSGHVARLVNVFSAIELDFTISYREQIKANVLARLTAKLKNHPEALEEITDEKEEIPVESTLFKTRITIRKKYDEFLRTVIPEIKTELLEEFVPQYVTWNEFEEYFREGLMIFEGQSKS